METEEDLMPETAR